MYGEAPYYASMVGEAIYAPEAGENGLALCEIEERYRITHEQRVHFVVFEEDSRYP
jgi:hypothetical protein